MDSRTPETEIMEAMILQVLIRRVPLSEQVAEVGLKGIVGEQITEMRDKNTARVIYEGIKITKKQDWGSVIESDQQLNSSRNEV